MKLSIRLAASLALACTAFLAPINPASAQTASTSSGQAYPTKPIRVLLPFAGGTDAVMGERAKGAVGSHGSAYSG